MFFFYRGAKLKCVSIVDNRKLGLVEVKILDGIGLHTLAPLFEYFRRLPFVAERVDDNILGEARFKLIPHMEILNNNRIAMRDLHITSDLVEGEVNGSYLPFMNGPGYEIFFLGGLTIICGGLTAEGSVGGGPTIGGSAEGTELVEASAGEKREGAVGTLLNAGVVTRGLGGGGGWVGAGEGFGEGEEEGELGLVRAQFFVWAIFGELGDFIVIKNKIIMNE